MNFYPLFARLREVPCLIVGGGPVAVRKVGELLRAGARVTVNAPHFDARFDAFAAAGRTRLVAGTFDVSLIASHALVIAATNDAGVNAAVARAARQALKLCNVVDGPEDSSFIAPAVLDRSPLVIAISSGGQAPALTRLLRQRLERALPARLTDLVQWAWRWRPAVRQFLNHLPDRRRLWDEVFTGTTARRFLAGDEAGADAELRRLLGTQRHGGRAWLVGAGPGDPGLITVRGLELLQQADAVLYDKLVAPELLLHARREAELVCVGKRAGEASTEQSAINADLIARVAAGQRVCRLKGGDPFIFGRGGEEALALAQAGLEFEIVPGITAASGCAAAAGIPLTHRGLATAVTFMTGQTASDAVSPGRPGPAAQREDETLVIYMGQRHLAQLCADLLQSGRAPDLPAAVIAAGTTAQQQVVVSTLAQLADAAGKLPTPALLIVGQVAALAATLHPAAVPVAEWQHPDCRGIVNTRIAN